jgi:hypothetical protein
VESPSIQEETRGLRSAFDERGFVILRGFLEPEIIEGVRSELDRLVDRLADGLVRDGHLPHGFGEELFETRMIRLFENNLDRAPLSFRTELHRQGLYDLLFNPDLLDLAEQFLGPEIRLYPNYTVRPKLPDWDGTLVLWHQDGGYTGVGTDGPVDSLRMINLWAPLVPATVENGCMEFIPGSHRLGVVPHVRRKHYLEIVPEHIESRLPDAVPILARPGDVVLFHNLLFHRGLPNRSNAVRWSCDWRYQDATQPTLRTEQGHIARSRAHPARAVHNAQQWAELTWQ